MPLETYIYKFGGIWTCRLQESSKLKTIPLVCVSEPLVTAMDVHDSNLIHILNSKVIWRPHEERVYKEHTGSTEFIEGALLVKESESIYITCINI